MKILSQGTSPRNFFSLLSAAQTGLLMLDYDGTLAPFTTNRQDAVPYAGVRALIERIMASSACRVVIISGRWIQDLLPLLQLKRRPEIWGSHGWERLLADGTYRQEKITGPARKALDDAQAWLRSQGLYDRCEFKPACIALHWRGMGEADVDALRNRIMSGWPAVPNSDRLIMGEFDGGLEMKVPGMTKGDAVRAILSEAGAGVCAAYLGDDYTDEDAFRALGARGLRVLVRPEFRETCADVWICPPQELLLFLEQWADARASGTGA